MSAQQYLKQVRTTTGFTDYRIGKNFKIPQPIISRYKNKKQTLSEKDAFVFGFLALSPVDDVNADEVQPVTQSSSYFILC